MNDKTKGFPRPFLPEDQAIQDLADELIAVVDAEILEELTGPKTDEFQSIGRAFRRDRGDMSKKVRLRYLNEPASIVTNSGKSVKDMTPLEMAAWLHDGVEEPSVSKDEDIYREPSDWMLENDIDYGK